MTLRVGIVSANWGAMAHLPAWRAVPGIEVSAICTSRRETAEAAAARFGIGRAFWDADAMAWILHEVANPQPEPWGELVTVREANASIPPAPRPHRQRGRRRTPTSMAPAVE